MVIFFGFKQPSPFYLTKIFFYIIITTNVIVKVVITQITLKKVMQILEGSMSFVEWKGGDYH